MVAGSHIGFDDLMLDHPRNATVGISSVLKYGLDPIYSVGDRPIAIFIFCRFGLKLPIHAHFLAGVGLGTYFPQIWSSIVLNPKRTILE